MRYIPKTMRLEQHGLLVLIRGFKDAERYRNGQVVIDMHGTLGRYQHEEEFLRILVTLFNNHMQLLEESEGTVSTATIEKQPSRRKKNGK